MAPPSTSSLVPVETLYAARAAGQTGSPIDASTSILQGVDHDVVRLAMGSPAGELVPTALFEELLGEAAALGAGSFDYGPTEGEPILRECLLDFLAARGQAVAPAELLVTTGGMQGLDLVAKLFVGPGDLVAVESPTYTNGTATISGYEGELMAVPGDEEGMDVEALAALAAAGRPPKLIYTIPTFQNPAGTTLSLERRLRLVELAAAWDAIVLEDDPYSLLRFAGEELPSLRELAAGRARVIGVHTFSKLLAPGLRVGWLVAEPAVVSLMIDARQGMDTCTNTPLQRMVAGFLAGGHMDGHLDALRAEYRVRKNAMQQALAEELAGLDVRWTDPEGGFFLWLTLPPEVDADALVPLALADGVAFIPGSAFSIDRSFRNAVRLAFSAEPPERARVGIQRLRRAIDRHLAVRDGAR